MLAYSKRTLQFRDQSAPLSDQISQLPLNGKIPPSWTFEADGESEDLEFSGRDEGPSPSQPSQFASPEGFGQRLSFSESPTFQPNNEMYSQKHTVLPPAIYPAEHNSIAHVSEHLSEPWASSLFSFETFNAVQSACFNPAACTDDNMVVSAPTGCGKTVIFELGILRLLSCRRLNQDAKVVFMAPIKALCQEKCADWTARFSKLGIKVAELNGDQIKTDMKEVTSAQIICTTPEKWDSITRRWTEHIYLLGKVQLLLVDEAHTLGENRGSALEAVVCRMKTVARSTPINKYNLPAKDLRIIALSATLPNLTCIGEFVNAKSENIMAFDGSFRPVPLTVHVLGYAAQSSDFWFEKLLEKKVPEVISRFSAGRPSLVFCTSRKSTETTVDILCRSNGSSARCYDPALTAAAQRVGSPSLREALLRGIAFHHANLPPDERSLIEDLFRERKLHVLCCTTTLAMGVNLPAHLVVIKSTAQWQGKASGYSQMLSSTILQMMGRAGRQGLDDHGIAVIMTDEGNKRRYENMSSGCEIIESSLNDVLPEVLNSEVCNSVIESVEDAAKWVKSTFLYTRLKKNPARYGLKIENGEHMDDAVVTFLDGKISAAMRDLTSSGVMTVENDGCAVKARKPGHIMSRNMLQLQTMKSIMSVTLDADMNEILLALSSAAEVLQEVRMGQKKYLKDLNRLVRFGLPKSKKIDSVDKTYLLLQNVLGRSPMDDVTMQREQIIIGENAGRVLQGLCDHLIDVRGGRAVLSSVILRRNFERSLWETGVPELNQLAGLSPKELSKLVENGYDKLLSVAEASAMEVDNSAGRRAPFGTRLVASARRILGQALSLHVGHDSNQGRVTINITRKITSWPMSSSSNDVRIPDSELVSYTLIAFTKQQAQDVTQKKTSRESGSIHGLHLYRKIIEPCVVELPRAAIPAVRASALLISLVANFVGLDDHKSLVLHGAERTSVEKEAEYIGDNANKAAADSGDGKAAGVTSKFIKKVSNTSSSSTPLNLSGDIDNEVSLQQRTISQPETCDSAASIPTIDIASEKFDQFRFVASTATDSKQEEIMNLSRVENNCEVGSSTKTPKSVKDKIEIWSSESPHIKKALSRSWNIGKEHDDKSVSTKANSTSKGQEWNQLPQVGMFSRKASVGNRDIRDCLFTNPLNTIRRKATEMNLLETVKSSKLSGQPYTSASPDHLPKKTRLSTPLSPNDADAVQGNVPLEFEYGVKNNSQTDGDIFCDNRSPPAPPTSHSFFKRRVVEGAALHSTPQLPSSDNSLQEKSQEQRDVPRHRQGTIDSRSDHYGPQLPAPPQARSKQSSPYPSEFRKTITQMENQTQHLRNQGHQYLHLQNHPKNTMNRTPIHMNMPAGFSADVQKFPRPPVASVSAAFSESTSNKPRRQSNVTSNQLELQSKTKPEDIPASKFGKTFQGRVVNHAQRVSPTLGQSAHDRHVKQPTKLTPDTNSGFNLKRPLSSQGAQYQMQQQRPTKARGTPGARIPFDRKPLSQADFDEFF